MAHGEKEVFFTEIFCFLAWLKACKQPIPTQLTFYIKRRVYERAHVG